MLVPEVSAGHRGGKAGEPDCNKRRSKDSSALSVHFACRKDEGSGFEIVRDWVVVSRTVAAAGVDAAAVDRANPGGDVRKLWLGLGEVHCGELEEGLAADMEERHLSCRKGFGAEHGSRCSWANGRMVARSLDFDTCEMSNPSTPIRSPRVTADHDA